MQEATERRERGRRRGLFGKYVAYFVGLVVFVLAVNGGLETWFMYRETTDNLASTQSERADTAARRIEQFVNDIERQLSWATRASNRLASTPRVLAPVGDKSPTQRVERDFAGLVIAADDQQVLARRGVPSGRIIVHAAVAHVHAINDGIAKRSTTLDHSPAHAVNVGH